MPKKRSLDKPIEVSKEGQQTVPFRTDNYDPRKTRILWMTVGSFIVIITVLWGWSLKAQIASFKWATSSEVKVVKDAQTTWNEIYKKQQDQDSAYTEAKAKLERILNSVEQAATASTTIATSTATTTLDTATSTPTTTPSKK